MKTGPRPWISQSCEEKRRTEIWLTDVAVLEQPGLKLMKRHRGFSMAVKGRVKAIVCVHRNLVPKDGSSEARFLKVQNSLSYILIKLPALEFWPKMHLWVVYTTRRWLCWWGKGSRSCEQWIWDWTVHVFPMSTLGSYTALGLDSVPQKHISFWCNLK